MKNSRLFRLVALVAAMMCALGASAAEAYANYTPDNTTLTFYYDNLRSTRPGTTYDLNTGDNFPAWRVDGTYANVTKVVFNSSFAGARPTSTYHWFFMMENLQSITGITYLNTSEVTDMTYMFSDCTKLTSLDVSNFNTSKVTTMKGMFNACSSLTSLDVSHFNTSNVTDMSWMFQNCEKLTSLDVSSFNTAKVNNMSYMFANCSLLTTIYAGDGWSTAAVTSSDDMFYYCTSLVGGLGTTYDVNHIDKTYAHIDGGPSNPGYLTDNNEAYACYTPSNTTLTFYYDNLRSTRTGRTYDLNSFYPGWYSDGTSASVTKVVFNSSFANARPTRALFWFCTMTNLQSITGIAYLNTSQITDMYGMFASCNALTSLDVSNFNTANVTNMDLMFLNCSNLKTIYVGDGWSTAAVTSSNNMFYNCTKLVGGLGTTYDSNHEDKTYAHIDRGPYDPGYFTDINSNIFVEDGIFYKIQAGGTTVAVTQVQEPVNNEYIQYTAERYNIPATVTHDGKTYTVTMLDHGAFFNCTNVKGVTIPETVTTIGNTVFKDCTGLTRITIPNSVTTMGMYVFENCTALKDVIIGSGMTSIGSYTFHGCTALESGNITCKAIVPPTLKSTTFDTDHYHGANVYVPYGYLNFYEDAPYWENFWDMYEFFTFDEALNVAGGNIHFESTGGYPWETVQEGGRVYAKSGNAGEASTTSTLTATVTATAGDILEFDFKAWGEGTSTYWDRCSFYINGVEQIAYGAYQNADWETYSVYLPAGECTLEWKYSKDDSVNPTGDYFAVDNVAIISAGFTRGDVNGDGSVNISDVTTLIDYLLSGNASGVNLSAADCNQDSSVNISDVTTLIDYLLSGNW